MNINLKKKRIAVAVELGVVNLKSFQDANIKQN
jgi:hypothetical protein